MAPERLLDRRVRPRQDEEVEYHPAKEDAAHEEIESEDESEAGGSSANESGSEDNKTAPEHDRDTSPEDGPEESADLKDISFGALAQAQAALGPRPRKRKLAETEPTEESSSTKPQRREPKEHSSRSSKHAPAIQSSRRAVTRRLEVFEPSPALKSRDPRFDPLIQSSTAADPNASDRANHNYSFLTSYQADEILSLKSQIKKSKTPHDAAELKRQLMSLQSKVQRAEALNAQKEVLRKHKREEREAIKSGVKERPYYMKQSDVKREVLTTRFEGMSKKAREKAVERKRKRVKGKESRHMPRLRRERE